MSCPGTLLDKAEGRAFRPYRHRDTNATRRALQPFPIPGFDAFTFGTHVFELFVMLAQSTAQLGRAHWFSLGIGG